MGFTTCDTTGSHCFDEQPGSVREGPRALRRNGSHGLTAGKEDPTERRRGIET